MENKIVKAFVVVCMYDYQGLGPNQYFGMMYWGDNALYDARDIMSSLSGDKALAISIYEYDITQPLYLGYKVQLIGIREENERAHKQTIPQIKRMVKECERVIRDRLVTIA